MKINSLVFLILLSCAGVYAAISRESNSDITTRDQFVGERQYDINFQIERETAAQHSLWIVMKLYHNSHYVSPHAKRDFSGKFQVSLDDNPYVALDSNFLETPRSIEEYDPHPFVNGTVNWVRENTRYKYPLHLLSSEDFEVNGMVRFVIEPNCTMEEIRFVIYQEDGILKVENKTIQKCHKPETK